MRQNTFEWNRRHAKYAPRKGAERMSGHVYAGDDDERPRGHGMPQRREHVRDSDALQQIREFRARY